MSRAAVTNFIARSELSCAIVSLQVPGRRCRGTTEDLRYRGDIKQLLDGTGCELTSVKYGQDVFVFFSREAKEKIFSACLKHICMLPMVCYLGCDPSHW